MKKLAVPIDSYSIPQVRTELHIAHSIDSEACKVLAVSWTCDYIVLILYRTCGVYTYDEAVLEDIVLCSPVLLQCWLEQSCQACTQVASCARRLQPWRLPTAGKAGAQGQSDPSSASIKPNARIGHPLEASPRLADKEAGQLGQCQHVGEPHDRAQSLSEPMWVSYVAAPRFVKGGSRPQRQGGLREDKRPYQEPGLSKR